jgi:hypothetical protein
MSYSNKDYLKKEKGDINEDTEKKTRDKKEKNVKSYDDFSSLAYETLTRIPFFLIFIIVILYFIVSTDIYDKYVLYKINKSFIDENDNKSTSGVLVTGLIMGLLSSILFLANSSGFI